MRYSFQQNQATVNCLKIYNFIYEFIQEKEYSPTIREIAAGTGLSSTETIHSHLKTLKEKGMLTFEPWKPRTIRLTPGYSKAAGE
jgi:repressor LexA